MRDHEGGNDLFLTSPVACWHADYWRIKIRFWLKISLCWKVTTLNSY